MNVTVLSYLPPVIHFVNGQLFYVFTTDLVLLSVFLIIANRLTCTAVIPLFVFCFCILLFGRSAATSKVLCAFVHGGLGEGLGVLLQ